MSSEDSTLNNEALHLKGTITKDDFIHHNRYHFKNYNRIFVGSTFLIFIAVFSIYTSLIDESIGLRIFLLFIFLIFSIVLALLLWLWAKLLNKFRAAKEYKSDQLIQNEIYLTITTEEIQQKVRRSVHHIQWSDILAAHEHQDMFRLYISKNKAILIPTTFFNSPNEIEKLKELISGNVSKDKITFL
ncbi:YcxB family protein [Lysinibacillus sphaericus]